MGKVTQKLLALHICFLAESGLTGCFCTHIFLDNREQRIGATFERPCWGEDSVGDSLSFARTIVMLTKRLLIILWQRRPNVKILALLAIAVYFSISIIADIQPGWFEFVQNVPGRDKLLHFLGASLLSILMVIGISPVVFRNRIYGPFSMLIAIAMLITLDEFGQLAIPSRTFDLGDLGWSYAGIAVFGLPAIWLRRFRESA